MAEAKPASRSDTAARVFFDPHHHTLPVMTEQQYEALKQAVELLWYVSQCVNGLWWRALTRRGRTPKAGRLRATQPRPNFLSYTTTYHTHRQNNNASSYTKLQSYFVEYVDTLMHRSGTAPRQSVPSQRICSHPACDYRARHHYP